MRTLVKTAVLGLGLLTSGTAMANNNFGGSPAYNPQYSYYGPSYYYGGYPDHWNYNTGYPHYYSYYYPGYNYTYSYGYPYYGSYPATNYPYWNDPTMASHPYSRNNPNWIPYVGWR
jgi:hypothetical protein